MTEGIYLFYRGEIAIQQKKEKNEVIIAKDNTFMYFVMKFTQQFVKIQFYQGKSMNKISLNKI